MPAPSPEETEDAAAPSSVSENDYLLDFINVKELNDKELLGVVSIVLSMILVVDFRKW